MFEIAHYAEEKHDIIIEVFPFSFGEEGFKGAFKSRDTAIIETNNNLREKI